jgi:hypothetical protein
MIRKLVINPISRSAVDSSRETRMMMIMTARVAAKKKLWYPCSPWWWFLTSSAPIASSYIRAEKEPKRRAPSSRRQ